MHDLSVFKIDMHSLYIQRSCDLFLYFIQLVNSVVAASVHCRRFSVMRPKIPSGAVAQLCALHSFSPCGELQISIGLRLASILRAEVKLLESFFTQKGQTMKVNAEAME